MDIMIGDTRVNPIKRCMESDKCRKKVKGFLGNIKSAEMEYKNGKFEMEIDFKKKRKNKEYLIGGQGDFISDSMFDKRQLKMGIMEEMEHSKSKRIAKEIAKDHLAKIPDYYSRLNKMESKAKRNPGRYL
jgi:hypothetical protein